MAPRKKTLSANALSSGVAQPQHEEIALRAYEFFLQRGCTHGRDLEDWLQAERELLDKIPRKSARRRKSESIALPVS
jgi:DUF2934 family protein